MNPEGLIRKAKRLLRLGMQGETHPQQSRARLQQAWSRADQYKKEHPLDAQEEAIFDAAILSHVGKRYSRSDDYFESALATLRQFRAQQAELRARPVKQVAILPEGDWQPVWRQERRLALLFEPEIEQDWSGTLAIKPVWLPLPRWPNRLDLIGRAADFATDADASRPDALDRISITRRGELAQWQGSSFSIRESNDARELGPQVFSRTTSVDASITLAGMTFDHLRERLEAAVRDRRETDRLLLACGFMAGNIAIPRPRPIGRNEKIRGPVVIDQETPRTWFEIVCVAETEPRSGPARMECLERWIAVEV